MPKGENISEAVVEVSDYEQDLIKPWKLLLYNRGEVSVQIQGQCEDMTDIFHSCGRLEVVRIKRGIFLVV